MLEEGICAQPLTQKAINHWQACAKGVTPDYREIFDFRFGRRLQNGASVMSRFDQAELLDERAFRFRFTNQKNPYRGGVQRFWHGTLIEYVYSVLVHETLATTSSEVVQDQICGGKD